MSFSYVSVIGISIGLSASIIPLVSSCKKLAGISMSMEKDFMRHEKTGNFFSSYLGDFQKEKAPSDFRLDESFSVKAESLNSKINMNFLPESILKDGVFDRYFRSSECRLLFLDEVKKGKLFYSQKEMENYMAKDVFLENFTFYTSPDLNICPQWSLEKIFGTNSIFSIEKIIGMQKNNLFIKNREELQLSVGVDADFLLPFISFKSPVDVNFVEENLLLSLLSCKIFKLSAPSNACRKIIDLRRSRKISEGDLKGIFKVPSNNLIYRVLGTESSCFKFTVSDEKGKVLESVVLFNNDSVKILEERWL